MGKCGRRLSGGEHVPGHIPKQNVAWLSLGKSLLPVYSRQSHSLRRELASAIGQRCLPRGTATCIGVALHRLDAWREAVSVIRSARGSGLGRRAISKGRSQPSGGQVGRDAENVHRRRPLTLEGPECSTYSGRRLV